MQIAITLLVFAAIAQSEESENLFLEDSNTEYEEDTAKELLCSDLNATISLTNLNLNQIQQNFLSGPQITCLDLYGNSITKVYSKAFEKVPNLKYLDLSNNEFDISVLLKEDFLGLETLILNNCRRYYFDDLKIGGFYPKLKKLFLKNIGLISIQSAFKENLPSLAHLYLSDNDIRKNNFMWLPDSIEYIDLSRNKLQALTLTNLTNLRKLFLDNQYSKYLSTIHFENLINLKYLSTRSNNIGDILDSTFRNATSLTYLDISDNNVKQIAGGSFNSMKNLQFLNLSNNYLEILQATTFDQLQNLETLILEKNLINLFPTVGYEIKLKTLLLNCNKIRTIIGGTFSKMPFLESLFLHDNELSYLDQEAFRGLNSLKILTLSNNRLSQLPLNWMIPLTSLNTLDLIGNSLKNFSDLALSESSGLQYLYLSKQLEFMNAQALFGIPDNVTIDLREKIVFIEQCNKQCRKYDPNNYSYCK